MALAAPVRSTDSDGATAPDVRERARSPLKQQHDRLRLAYRDFPQLGEPWRVLVGGRARGSSINQG